MRIRLLKKEEVFGKGALQIFKTYGPTASPSDLAALQLCWPYPRGTTSENKASGAYYIRFDNPTDLMRSPIVSTTGEFGYLELNTPQGGVRPVIPSEKAKSLNPTSIRELKIKGKGSVQLATFGEYPQKLVNLKTHQRLEKLLLAGLKIRKHAYSTGTGKSLLSSAFNGVFYIAHGSPLKRTHRSFTMENAIPNSYDYISCPRIYQEYQLEGKKYIHFFPILTGDLVTFASGKQLKQPNRNYWIEVRPIEWIVDPSGTWVSKDILFSNMKMDDRPFQKRRGKFETSSLNKFLQETFSKEIVAPVHIARQSKKPTPNHSRQKEG